MATDKKLAQIRALLAKAEDKAATEEERETYNAKAAELMEAHRITVAMLGHKGQVIEDIVARDIEIDQPYGMAKGSLLATVADANTARVVLHTRGTGAWAPVSHVTVVAYPSDLERIEMLFTSLLLQAAPLLQAKVPMVQRDDGKMVKKVKDTSSYRYNLMQGFTDAVAHRFAVSVSNRERDERAQPSTGEPSGALVLRDRDKQVEDFYRKLFPHLSSGKGRKAGAGYGDGYAAGQKADFGTRAGAIGRSPKALNK
jgi:hypothetical protein